MPRSPPSRPDDRDPRGPPRGNSPQRRNVLLPALRALGFTIATEPQGAFYVYADVSPLAEDC